MKTDPKDLFLPFLKSQRVPPPVKEYKFHPVRKWRIDFAWPRAKVGLEVDGAVFTQGRHTRGTGWLKDTEKLNAAAMLGWRMLRCTPKGLITMKMIETIQTALKSRPISESVEP
jgi:very-short-patch-repair endonuclease